MSIRSIRTTARRSPVAVGAVVLSAGLLLSGCGDDVVDDGVEQDVEEGVDDAEQGVEDAEEDVEQEVEED